MRRLERLVGRTLFERTRTGVRLTADGDAVLIYARAMTQLTDELKRHFSGGASVIKINVGMSEDYCRTALPTVLWLFMREHPNVEIRVVSGTYADLSNAFERDEIHFAVMRRYSSGGEATLLWTDDMVWVGRPGAVPPVGEPVPLVLPSYPNPGRETAIDALRGAGRSWRIPFESHSLTGIGAALQAGIGIWIAPRNMKLHLIQPLDDSVGLQALPKAEYVLVRNPGRAPGPETAFIEVIKHAATSSLR